MRTKTKGEKEIELRRAGWSIAPASLTTTETWYRENFTLDEAYAVMRLLRWREKREMLEYQKERE